jgi:hypothetical protein
MKRKSYYSSNNNHSSSSGMGLLGVLQIIFIVLKCLDLINWTWVQVFIPTFISIGLLLIIIIVALVIIYGAAKDKM